MLGTISMLFIAHFVNPHKTTTFTLKYKNINIKTFFSNMHKLC